MSCFSKRARLAEGGVRLGLIDGGNFGLAPAALQKEERDDDKIANGLHAFIEEESRGHHRRVLAIRLEILVRTDKTDHWLRLGLRTEELERGTRIVQSLGRVEARGPW